MTILIAMVARDAVCLAADTRTHNVQSKQPHPSPERKYRIEHGTAVWAIGGITNAFDSITMAGLPPQGSSLGRLNTVVRNGIEATSAEYDPLLRKAGMPTIPMYSFVLGFENGAPTVYSNFPEEKRYERHANSGMWAMSTSSDQTMADAQQLLQGHLVADRTLQFDAFASEVTALAVGRHPLEIAFPLELVLIRKGQPPIERSMAGALDRSTTDWMIEF